MNVARPHPDPHRATKVLVAGGGIAALETVLALRELAGDLVQIELLSAAEHFIYRPLQVLEPFQPTPAPRVKWSELAAELGIERTASDLRLIEPDLGAVKTTDAAWVGYDTLVLTTGALARQALRGVVTLGHPGSTYALRRLIARLKIGAARQLAFICPTGCSWTLGLYELALMSARAAADARAVAELTVVTAESEPLEVLGPEAGAVARALLDEAGIHLLTDSRAARFQNRRLEISGRAPVVADAAVSLPRLAGPAIAGVRCTAAGFLTVDANGLVEGEDNIYAAGDVTDGPLKQGGIAAQQADAAAAHIAAVAGAQSDPAPAQPVLRAALLTAGASTFLRRELEAPVAVTEVSREPLWWPAAKVVGRYLAPYLATRSSASR